MRTEARNTLVRIQDNSKFIRIKGLIYIQADTENVYEQFDLFSHSKSHSKRLVIRFGYIFIGVFHPSFN